MPLKLAAQQIEESNKVLELIASGYAKQSAEYRAIELGAKALLFVFQREVLEEFKLFLKKCDSELTDVQKRRLRDFGLEP